MRVTSALRSKGKVRVERQGELRDTGESWSCLPSERCHSVETGSSEVSSHDPSLASSQGNQGHEYCNCLICSQWLSLVLRSQQAKEAGRCGLPGRQRGRDDPGSIKGRPLSIRSLTSRKFLSITDWLNWDQLWGDWLTDHPISGN